MHTKRCAPTGGRTLKRAHLEVGVSGESAVKPDFEVRVRGEAPEFFQLRKRNVVELLLRHEDLKHLQDTVGG